MHDRSNYTRHNRSRITPMVGKRVMIGQLVPTYVGDDVAPMPMSPPQAQVSADAMKISNSTTVAALKTMKVGDLISRIEAPTMLYRITSRHGAGQQRYARALPYRFSGREVFIMPMRVGRKTVLAGDGSQWTKQGEAP